MAKQQQHQLTAAMASRLKAVVANIYDIMGSCKGKGVGARHIALEQIVVICLDSDIAYKMHVHAERCGIHPESRGKKGVDPFKAQNLALELALHGYSETKLESPMGFEKAAPGPAASAQCVFMKRNFALANGLLKEIDFIDAEYFPVTGGHILAAVNIILGEGVLAPVSYTHLTLPTKRIV